MRAHLLLLVALGACSSPPITGDGADQATAPDDAAGAPPDLSSPFLDGAAASDPISAPTDDLASADLSLCIPNVTPIGISVHDGAGRLLNARGIHLDDWDGFVANPAPTLTLRPPSNISFPATATLSANHQRLYFDLPSTVGAGGPTKSVSFVSASSVVTIRLGIFPDRDGVDEQYALTLALTGLPQRTEQIAITVHDHDQSLPLETRITVDYSQDKTNFFTSTTARDVLQQAADDWAYFFADAPYDVVPQNDELKWIWNADGFNTGTVVGNASAYTGFLLYAYGIHTSAPPYRSGGEGSYEGKPQRSGGIALPLCRSGGVAVETVGNYNQLGWSMALDPDGWWMNSNLGGEANDLYSIVHHEMGHAHGFNGAYSKFVAGRTGGLGSPALTAYFGGPLTIDPYDHFDAQTDPASGFGAFGSEYKGLMPRKRWMITRLDLLAAEAVGHPLRALSFATWQDNVPSCQ